jgi:hypothetical protein
MLSLILNKNVLKYLRQSRGKIFCCSRQKCGKCRRKSRRKVAVNQNVVCRDFAATFSEILENKFRGKSRVKLTNTL